MEYRFLGPQRPQRLGTVLRRLGHVRSQMNVDAAADCMTAAFDAGVNFFDNAEAYAGGQAEEIMGQVIRRVGWKRSDLVISTKIFWGGKGPNDRGLSRKHIIEGTDASLQRLGLDYVDLLFCHRADLHTPVEETVRAMNHVIDQGKALYWARPSGRPSGSSRRATSPGRTGSSRPSWSSRSTTSSIATASSGSTCRCMNTGALARPPGAHWPAVFSRASTPTGIPEGSRPTLPGYEWLRSRFEDDEARRTIAAVQDLASVAADLGGSVAQLAIAWCLANPHVSTVILGASNRHPAGQNLGAMALVDRLDDTAMERIEAIVRNRPEPEKDWREG
jgi:aryl-alcohol dehydrogenase-like predicted oxidoreductase